MASLTAAQMLASAGQTEALTQSATAINNMTTAQSIQASIANANLNFQVSIVTAYVQLMHNLGQLLAASTRS
ncbi:hypothetical protein AWB78_08432 [Caballeronia calidae]|uniref:Uncharacterized protein n=1 Tax=Caballeronia calidae TaxID=1777139 RepID=A0A158EJV3_9BURK|nr:hypothetical protein [Caballeronia calidae]SAL07129.1 hypothetical protein AWB78_08432 [Caballeronia calidae]